MRATEETSMGQDNNKAGRLRFKKHRCVFKICTLLLCKEGCTGTCMELKMVRKPLWRTGEWGVDWKVMAVELEGWRQAVTSKKTGNMFVLFPAM